MAAPQLYAADARYCIGFWNNIALVDAVGDIDAPRMRQLGVAYKELLAPIANLSAWFARVEAPEGDTIGRLARRNDAAQSGRRTAPA